LSEEVERDSQSGKLSRGLMAQGQTLYGKSPLNHNYLERITPDGKSHLVIGAMVSLLKIFAYFGNKKPRRHRVTGEGEALDSKLLPNQF
tara:strand:+ start:117 stop:383 length:267 start_codon:yes stop_codon:yes gene_type:complete